MEGSGDKNLVNVGWTHYNAGQLIWWFCLTSRSGVSQRDFLDVKGDQSLTSNKWGKPDELGQYMYLLYLFIMVYTIIFILFPQKVKQSFVH